MLHASLSASLGSLLVLLAGANVWVMLHASSRSKDLAAHTRLTISSSPTQSGYVEITPKRVPNGYVSAFLNDRAGRTGGERQSRGVYLDVCGAAARRREG
jgi:hypothetical protein